MSIDSMMMDVDAGGSDFEMSDEPPPKKGRAKAAPKKTAAAAKKAPARGKAKAKIVKDVTQLVLARRTRMCNFLEYKGALS